MGMMGMPMEMEQNAFLGEWEEMLVIEEWNKNKNGMRIEVLP